jgi:ribonuclease HIII
LINPEESSPRPDIEAKSLIGGTQLNGSESFEIDPHRESELKIELERAGFRFSDSSYSFWRATDGKHTLTFYLSGKLLVQGKGVERLSDFLGNKAFVLSESHPIRPAKYGVSKWVGTDESGKGDYFGPLVVAAVLATTETRKELLRMGVRDSKSLSDSAIKKMALKIKLLCPHSIIVITPSRYNKAYETLHNYGKHNRILAWGHAKAIENILEKEICHYAVTDQFGHERFLRNALMKKGRLIRLEQRPHAEDDIAVAAASILARDEYKTGLEALSKEYSIDLPAGASNKVIEVGKEFVQSYGKDELREIAKLHFVTTKYILDPEFFNKANP